MVAGYHLIWVAYGWWLPNDPRGSWSDILRVEKIAGLGEPHFGRKLKQPLPVEIRRFYEQAGDFLAHALLTFDDDEIAIIAGALAQVIEERGYTCYACAIMPEHVHLLIRRHRDKSEEMIQFFQHASRAALIAANKRSLTHPVWGGPGWKGYLNTRADFERVVKYIRDNPVKIGGAVQEWGFVESYDGWMPGYCG